mgnify:FL=1
MLSFEETLELIRKAKNGDNTSKEKLLENNVLLIKSVVLKFRNKGVDYDDLYQLGCIGFLKAIYNFDEKFGVRFSTYAVPMILGEVKRFLRDDGEIKVSRIIKMQAAEINKYVQKYKNETGEEPTVEKIAEDLGMEKEDVVFALDSSKMPVSIYEASDNGQDKTQSILDKLASDYSEDEHIDKLYLKNLINTLDERERKIIILRYFRDKTQGEVAEILGVSQVQVSRLESKIITKLKEKAE